MCKYYFIDEEEKNIYVLELNSSSSEDFEVFYLKDMATREYEFFENPSRRTQDYFGKTLFKNLTVEKYSRDRVEELLEEVGKYKIFAVNGWGAYDYYGCDRCQLYRDCLATVLGDAQNDFIGIMAVFNMVHNSLNGLESLEPSYELMNIK